jgi:hypothetical protein
MSFWIFYCVVGFVVFCLIAIPSVWVDDAYFDIFLFSGTVGLFWFVFLILVVLTVSFGYERLWKIKK